MTKSDIISSIIEILVDARDFIRTTEDPENDINLIPYGQLKSKIQLLHLKFDEGFFEEKVNYKELLMKVQEACMVVKNQYPIRFFKKNLIYFLLSKIRPTDEEIQLFRQDMMLLMKDNSATNNVEQYWYDLATQLIKYDPLEVIKAIISMPLPIHLKFLNHIKLGENFDALCHYMREIFEKVKALCDDEEGDIYGAALINFILTFTLNVPDSNDQIVTRFYNLIRPQMGGKLKRSALVRQLVSLAAGTCCHVINDKVPKHSKAIVEALRDSSEHPILYRPALEILAKSISIKLEFSNYEDIIPLIKPAKDCPLELYDRIRVNLKRNFPNLVKTLFEVGKSQCPELIACDENFDPIVKMQYIHRLCQNRNFSNLKTILTPETYNVEVSDVVCELISSGYPSETIFKTCVKNREMISPTINSLTTNVPRFYHDRCALDLLGLLTSLFQYLLTYPELTFQKQCITELQFHKLDAIAYLFLSDINTEMNSSALLLMQTSLELFAITHPNWEKMSFQQLPSYAFVAKQLGAILNAKFFVTPEEMTDKAPKKTIYDASIFLVPDLNRINYVCKLCTMQISQSIELRSAMEKIFASNTETSFSAGKFAIIAATSLFDIQQALEEALANIDDTVVVGLATANDRLRGTILEKLMTSKVNSDAKVKIISFMVQKMLAGPKQPKMEHVQLALDILMQEYQAFTKGFDGQHDIPSVTMIFAYAADQILKYLPTPKREQFEKLNDFIKIQGINALKSLSTGIKSELRLPYHNLLVLRLYLTTLSLLLPHISEIQAKGAFKRAMILGDIQPCYATLSECTPFFEKVKETRPQLLEPMIMSIPVLTSIQNCVLFAVLGLRYFDMMQDKVYVLFLACIADSVQYVNCPSIKGMMEGLEMENMKFTNIPSDNSLTNYLYSKIPHLSNEFVEASIKIFNQGITNAVMQCVFESVIPWVHDIKILLSDMFKRIYGPIFPAQVNPELWKLPIRREIIRNTFTNYGDSASVLSNAMRFCMKNKILDETTWHAFLKVNPELCLAFVFAEMIKGTYDETFEHVVNVSPHFLKDDAIYIIGSALMLNSTSIDVFRVSYQQVINFCDANKIEYDPLLTSVDQNTHEHFSMNESLFGKIISAFEVERRIHALLTLVVFIDTTPLLFNAIKAEKKNITEPMIQNFHRYTAANLSSDKNIPYNCLLNFFRIAPTYCNPITIMKELLSCGDKDAAQAALGLISITRKTNDAIDELLALAIARGLVKISEASPYVYAESSQSLKFWCTENDGQIDSRQLRAFISYPNEETIEVAMKKAKTIPNDVLTSATPLIFAPNIIEFSKLMPFFMQLDKSKLTYPPALADKIDESGGPINTRLLLGYFVTRQ